MDKRLVILLLGVFLLLIILPLQANTEKSTEKKLLGDEEVFEMLKSSFLAQVSLSEKGRSTAEVEAVLAPFFSKEYKKMFIDENIVEEEGQYLTYGSDMAQFYIPFYSYSDRTKVVHINDSIYVVEYFPASTEGPVGYESHYEGIELAKVEGGWKVVAKYFDDLPKEVIEKASD